MQNISIVLILIFCCIGVPFANGAPSIEIVMEKTTFSYCEKLFYTIKVSEITEEVAIIHIRDQSGKTSSAIQIAIPNLETPVPSLVAFDKDIFPIGKYFVDIEYSGAKNSAEFNLIDSGKTCIPAWIKQLTYYWITEQIPDSTFSDGIQFLIQKGIIIIPETLIEEDKKDTEIPHWIKNNAVWWVEEKISDSDFAQGLQFLIKVGIIII